MLDWLLFWVRFPREFNEQRKLTMALKDDVQKLIAAMNDATNAIAARIDALKAQIAGGVTPEDATAITDALTAEVAKLQALGADPANPVPTV